MSALYLAASRLHDEATTYGAREYYAGVRDSFEAMFRAVYGMGDDPDTEFWAYQALYEALGDGDAIEPTIEGVQDVLVAKREDSRGDYLRPA